MIEEGNSADDGVDEAILAALKSRAEDYDASSPEDDALVAAAVNEYLGGQAASDGGSRGGVPWLAVVGLVAAAAALAMFLLPTLTGSENQHASKGEQAVLEAEERTTTQQAVNSSGAQSAQDGTDTPVDQDTSDPHADEAGVDAPSPGAEQVDPQPEPTAPTSKRKPNPSEDDLLQRARQQRADQQFKAAARSYEQFLEAYPKSKKVPATLVSLAQLYQGPLSDPSRALRHYDRYLKRGGPLAEEAHYGKIRALRSLGRSGKAQSEVEAFLASYPNSAYADALSKK